MLSSNVSAGKMDFCQFSCFA